MLVFNTQTLCTHTHSLLQLSLHFSAQQGESITRCQQELHSPSAVHDAFVTKIRTGRDQYKDLWPPSKEGGCAAARGRAGLLFQRHLSHPWIAPPCESWPKHCTNCKYCPFCIFGAVQFFMISKKYYLKLFNSKTS